MTRYKGGSIPAAMRQHGVTFEDVAAIANVRADDVERMSHGDIFPPAVRQRVAAALLVDERDLWDVDVPAPRKVRG